MKILELFSGIGGMHYALKAGGIEVEVVAVEINPIATAVYQHNFPESTLMQTNILSLNINKINKFAPDVLLMSPPCQPFTRVGLKKDLNDVRTDPLKHILTLLPDLSSLSCILVENVKGFENSEARNLLVTCLRDLRFSLQEFLLSPTQIGVPNTRTRYYLLAKRQPLAFCFQTTGITDKLPEESEVIVNSLESLWPTFHSVADILETDDVTDEVFQEHLIPEELVEKRAWVMDVVTKESTRTCCFTKAYGRYAEGTGSVYCPYSQSTVDRVFAVCTRTTVDKAELRALHLRYFTPREVARLMCFPNNSFRLPATTTRKQAYQLLGNSVNVKVVTLLIRLMLSEPHR